MSERAQLLKTLMAMAEIYGRTMGVESAELYLEDLKAYPIFQVLKALQRCRKELPRFPTVADVIQRIDDGRPGVEEAWAMVPKDEAASVVWTEEMRDAFFSCLPLLATDQIAARQTFKERYSHLINEARSNGKKVVWSESFGHDSHGRERAVLEAIDKNRIGVDEAKRLLPDMGLPQRFIAIENKQENQGLTALEFEIKKPLTSEEIKL